MKKPLVLLMFTIIALMSNGQIKFEKAYFTNGSNEKINCLIKNLDWKNNPTSIEYKFNEDDASEFAKIDEIQEFGIENGAFYKRFTVKIDRSSDIIDKLSIQKDPEFVEETVFLKLILDGKAKLYKYEDKSLIRFFYSVNDALPQQLIYKRYISDIQSHLNRSYKRSGNTETCIVYNKSFKKQLYDNLKSVNISREKIQKIKYREKDLLTVFDAFNKEKDINYKAPEPKKHKKLFKLYLVAGLDQSSLKVVNNFSPNRSVDFGSQTNFRLGFEAELILPFNNNKWSVFMAPTYVKFEEKKELNIQSAEIDYQSIELPVGLRHYFFISKKSKIHVDASMAFNTDLSSKLKYSISQIDFDVKPTFNIGIGVGYDYKNIGSIEARYYTDRNIISNVSAMKADMKTFSISLKLNILR